MQPTVKTKPRTNAFSAYWDVYGGWREMRKSSYFRWSIGITVLLTPLWFYGDWWGDVITVVPSLLGFSLVAYTAVLLFSNERLVRILLRPRLVGEGEKAKPTVYETTSSAFVHFLLVQMVALAFALFFKAWYIPIPEQLNQAIINLGLSINTFVLISHFIWFFGYLAFVYSCALGVAATMRLYRLSEWTAKCIKNEIEHETDHETTPDPENEPQNRPVVQPKDAACAPKTR